MVQRTLKCIIPLRPSDAWKNIQKVEQIYDYAPRKQYLHVKYNFLTELRITLHVVWGRRHSDNHSTTGRWSKIIGLCLDKRAINGILIAINRSWLTGCWQEITERSIPRKYWYIICNNSDICNSCHPVWLQHNIAIMMQICVDYKNRAPDP